MKNILIKLLFLVFTVSQTLYADVNLEETMEIKFTPELQELAKKLEYNPIKIYHWVYNNVKFEDYEGSRKNVLSTYWTKRGNEWDQTSLLVTLMRISDIPARYIQYGTNDRVIAEIYTTTDNYRGVNSSINKIWIPLVPWLKENSIEKGIDLFPNGEIPEELNFDFDRYTDSIKQETALELFEKDLQGYLNIHHPGKSLKDIPTKETIIQKKSSILPLSLPNGFYNSGETRRFSTIENKDRVKVKVYLKNYRNNNILMEQMIYLPEIATSRLVIDFLPNSQEDKEIIEQYGLITQTPEGKANVKAVLRLDGKIISESSSLKTGDNFIYGYEIGTSKEDRPRKQVGTLISLTYDSLNISTNYITKLKDELNNIPVDVLNKDETKEEYLGRYTSIMNSQYQQRLYEAMSLTDQYLQTKRVMYKESVSPTIIYTFLDNIQASNEEKYLIHPSFNIDASIRAGNIYKITDNKYIEFISDFGTFSSNIYMYGASYNEGVIFEDWQSTSGGNSIKTLMVAKEQGIPVVKLTKEDIVDGHLYVLENQTIDRYSDYMINSYIKDIQNDNAIITTPVRKVNYEGMIMSASLTFADNYRAYFFNMDNGGGSSSENKENTSKKDENVKKNIESKDYTKSDERPSTDGSEGEGKGESTVPVEKDEAERKVISEGDPVDMAKGEFYQIERPDISIKSRGFNLDIKRTYKSQSTYNGIFGYGWTWSHMERILFAVNSDLIYFNEKGIPVNISANSDGTYNYDAGTTYILKKENNSYIFTFKDKSQKIFNEKGLLLKKIDSFGNHLTFEYNDSSNIKSITDSIGRSLELYYNQNGKVQTITDFLGRTVKYQYDGDNLISFTDLASNTTRYEYLKNQDNFANNHNMSKYILPTGDFLEIKYYKNDQVSHHINKKGETFHFQYSRYNKYSETWNEEGYYRKIFFNERNDVIRISTRDNTLEEKEYDINHNMISHTDGNGYKTTYTYDDKRNMLSKTNTLNETWIYEYDSNHNKKTLAKDPLNNIHRYTYDDKGNLIKVIDSLENITIYEYDNYGNKIKTIDALGNELIYTYDSFGINKTQTIDKNSNTTNYEYDQIGNRVSIINAKGDKKEISYNQYNTKSKVVDALGNETLFEYTKNNQLKRKTLSNGAIYEKVYDTARDIVTKSLVLEDIDPLGNSIKYTYDKVGNKIEKTNKRGDRYKFTYNALNKITSKTDPLNYTINYSYDANGKLIKEKSTRLVDFVYKEIETTYKYDASSRMIEKTASNGLVTSFSYNKLGKVTKKTYTVKGIDIVSTYQYNKKQKLIKQIDGYGSDDERVTSYEYDKLGRKTKEINPLGIETTYIYDNNSNVLSKSIDGKKIFEYVYNKLNKVVSVTNANEDTVSYIYNANLQKVSMTNAKGDTTQYSYDSVGNLIETISPSGNIKRYEYNLLNKKIKIIDSKNNTAHRIYDENQNIIKAIDFNGNTTHHSYDELNRISVKSDALNNKTTYSYDEVGNVVSKTNGSDNTTQYIYDNSNNILKEINVLENKEITKVYAYDKLNRVISIQDGNGNQIQIGYSIHNEKTSITNANGDVVQTIYDKQSKVVETIDAKGISTKLKYDNFSKLIEVVQAFGTSEESITTYTYDNVGNKLSQTKDNTTTTYEYDKLNYLIKTTVSGISALNSYDDENNLISLTDANGNITTYNYDANNNIINKVDASNNIYKYTYDNNNNILSITSSEGKVKQFEYNALNQQVKVIEDNAVKQINYHTNGKVKENIDFNGVVTSYEYDELKRVTKTIEAKNTSEEAITKYIYDNASNLVSIINAKDINV
ncbi:MAG: hypothetical protein DRG78_01425 [Epsilonproteobacteria bacterium]|nr:MAG: hypothetical protein DRG78_01425 [Campylobacterota bacterium]